MANFAVVLVTVLSMLDVALSHAPARSAPVGTVIETVDELVSEILPFT